MAELEDIDALNRLIRTKSPEALAAVQALLSPCVVDSEGQSPLNVAIQFDNAEVTESLLDSGDAVEFAPAVHSAESLRMMKTIYHMEGIDDIDLAERRVLNSTGVPPYWQRTPILQACRYQNRDAIRDLVARRAKLTTKDLVGETPLTLCLRSGGIDLAEHFIRSCINASKPFPFNEEVLKEICSSPKLFDLAIRHGRPNAGAKRFVFNLACATLDQDTVKEMLNNGFDVNSAIAQMTDPVTELVTSRLAWMHEVPGWETLAAGYAHVRGHSATTSISIPNDPGPDDLTYGETVALHARLNDSLRRKELNPKFMSTAERSLRLQMLGLLIESGLDVAKVESKLDFPLSEDVVSTNEPDFFVALTDAGFSLGPEDEYDDMQIATAIRHGLFDMVDPLEQCGHAPVNLKTVPGDRLEEYRRWQAASETSARIEIQAPVHRPRSRQPETYWELDGESVLAAETEPQPPLAGESCTLRLSHSNVYGPRTAVQFEVRVRSDDSDAKNENWQHVPLVSESVNIDGDDIDLASLDEPPFGETPWVGLFETTVTLHEDSNQIDIRITATDTNANGTLTDWVVHTAN
ncbi:MAG: hypothetical protein ACR2Q3_05995 [Woeseiaceae bacterium]